MAGQGLKVYPLTDDAGGLIKTIAKVGCDDRSLPIFASKAFVIPVMIDSVPSAVANILKQEMLSAKGDAAVHAGTISGKAERSAVVLLGTRSMYRDLIHKLAIQDYPTVTKVRDELRLFLDRMDNSVKVLKTRTGKAVGLDRVRLMGILNVTENSFYDGGKYAAKDEGLRQAEKMVREGADIIDVGGESSRPGAQPVEEAVEIERVVPIIEAIAKEFGTPISVDTVKSGVARAALEAGADIVNDISALRFDGRMAEVVAKSGANVVLMHMQGTPRNMQTDPRYEDVVGELIGFFDERVEFALGNGIDREKIIIDPGIGFGKKLEHNLEILSQLQAFGKYGLPVLVGVSRKSMIGALLGDVPPSERLYGTLGAHMTAAESGAAILRVHDVKEHREMLEIAYRIRQNG